MQALLPPLRSYRHRGLGRVTGLPRCRSKFFAIRVPGSQYRTQHDDLGPHKEYFQTPGKEPKPDLSPYIRESQRRSQSASQPRAQSLPSSTPHSQTAVEHGPPAEVQGPSRFRRFRRSVLWFLLFFALGQTAAIALITWEYFSPPFEPGSPEEQELIEEINEALDTHPMVQDLRDNEWIEMDPFVPDLQRGIKGRNMVHQTLGANNTQGIFMRVFHHPVQEYTMLVFFLGFGVEGWPDLIHGGIITTLLQEGLSKHLTYYYSSYFTTADNTTSIDFKKPCKPGEIYGVLVAPSGRKAITSGNVHLTELQMTSLLVQLAGAPVVSTQFDTNSNTEVHSVGIPTPRGRQPTHAVCQAVVKIIPKQLNHGGSDFQIGANDDKGFTKALEFLKSMPEFKGNPTSEPAPDDKIEDKDKD